MPLSNPPVSCGLSLKALSQKPMVPGAKTRCPGRWASSHFAVLYSMVVRMSIGCSQAARVAGLADSDWKTGQGCRDSESEGGAARNPRHPRPGHEHQREPEGHVHFQVVAFRLRHQRKPEPVAAQRGDSEQKGDQDRKARGRRHVEPRHEPRREQKRRRGRREVDALHGVGLEVVGHARGIGADHGDHGRRHPGQRQGVRVDAEPRGAEPGRGPACVEAREQVGRDGKSQRHRAQPVAQGHGRDPDGRQDVIPGPPFGQRHVQESDGQGEKAHRGEMGAFAVDDQRVQPAPGKPAAGVEAHFLHQQAGRRDQRVADAGDQGGGTIAAQTPRHPEERHRTERIDGGGHEVVRQAGRYAGARDYQSADHVEERRVGIGVRNAAVPEREPRELAEVVCDVAGEADVRGLDRPHLPRVVGVEEAQRDQGVECEQRQSARRCAQPFGGFHALSPMR